MFSLNVNEVSRSPETIFNRFQATKISSGLALKKKNVGSLVAKWQNIQQEVKRNQ